MPAAGGPWHRRRPRSPAPARRRLRTEGTVRPTPSRAARSYPSSILPLVCRRVPWRRARDVTPRNASRRCLERVTGSRGPAFQPAAGAATPAAGFFGLARALGAAALADEARPAVLAEEQRPRGRVRPARRRVGEPRVARP